MAFTLDMLPLKRLNGVYLSDTDRCWAPTTDGRYLVQNPSTVNNSTLNIISVFDNATPVTYGPFLSRIVRLGPRYTFVGVGSHASNPIAGNGHDGSPYGSSNSISSGVWIDDGGKLHYEQYGGAFNIAGTPSPVDEAARLGLLCVPYGVAGASDNYARNKFAWYSAPGGLSRASFFQRTAVDGRMLSTTGGAGNFFSKSFAFSDATTFGGGTDGVRIFPAIDARSDQLVAVNPPYPSLFPARLTTGGAQGNASTITGINCQLQSGFDFVADSALPIWVAQQIAMWSEICWQVTSSYGGSTPAGNSLIRANQPGAAIGTFRQTMLPTRLIDGRYAIAYNWRSGNVSDSEYFTGVVANPKGGVALTVPGQFARSFVSIDGGPPITFNLPRNPLASNFWYTPGVTFTTSPYLIYVTREGFILGIYRATNGEMWLCGAGKEFHIPQGCNNWSRAVSINEKRSMSNE